MIANYSAEWTWFSIHRYSYNTIVSPCQTLIRFLFFYFFLSVAVNKRPSSRRPINHHGNRIRLAIIFFIFSTPVGSFLIILICNENEKPSCQSPHSPTLLRIHVHSPTINHRTPVFGGERLRALLIPADVRPRHCTDRVVFFPINLSVEWAK